MIFTEEGSDSGDSGDESQSDQEDSESVKEDKPSFQMAQPWDSTACVGPAEEMEEESPAFADSEDELEMCENGEGWELRSDEDGLEENDGEVATDEEEEANTLKEQTAIYMEEEVGKYTDFRLH